MTSQHDHGTSVIACAIGVAGSQVIPADGALSRLGVGVATTILGWLATRLLTWLEKRWRGKP